MSYELDKAMKSHERASISYYTRILVDIDLNQDPPTFLTVERGNFVFSITIDYENLSSTPRNFNKPQKPGAHSRDRVFGLECSNISNKQKREKNKSLGDDI